MANHEFCKPAYLLAMESGQKFQRHCIVQEWWKDRESTLPRASLVTKDIASHHWVAQHLGRRVRGSQNRVSCACGVKKKARDRLASFHGQKGRRDLQAQSRIENRVPQRIKRHGELGEVESGGKSASGMVREAQARELGSARVCNTNSTKRRELCRTTSV